MDISVVIVNYKTYALTHDAIASVYEHSGQLSSEVILVDNGSNDGSVVKLKSDFEKEGQAGRFVIIENKENLGFSKGNNKGLALAKGDYIFLLNSDAQVGKGVLEKAVNYMKTEPTVGCVTARLVNEEGKLDQGCKRGFPNPQNALSYYLKLDRLFPKKFAKQAYKLHHLDEYALHSVDAISGAFMGLPKSVIDQVGLLDEEFFMYGEDLDWCYRIKQLGYAVHYNPALGNVLHYKGKSVPKLRLKTTYEFYRAMVLFYKKHYEKEYGFFMKIGVYLGVCGLFLLAVLKNGFKVLFDLLFSKLSH